VLWGLCGEFGDTLWATAAKLVTRNGPLRRIGDVLWANAANLVMRYGPLRQFGYALWASAANGDMLWATAANLVMEMGHCGNLVMRYGPLWRICLCSMGHCAEGSPTEKICEDFRTLGHSVGFGYALWVRTQDFILRYEPKLRILSCAMGPSAGFCSALWAIV
jgi:hypothetical protein